MKSILLAFVFAIGLMVSLPSTSSGSNAPPGQVSFVAAHYDIAQAIAVVQEPLFVVEYKYLAPVAAMVQEKGGAAIEKSLNTLLDVGYRNKDVIVNATDFTLISDYALKTYFSYKVEISQDTSIKNNVSTHRFARDGLTCRV